MTKSSFPHLAALAFSFVFAFSHCGGGGGGGGGNADESEPVTILNLQNVSDLPFIYLAHYAVGPEDFTSRVSALRAQESDDPAIGFHEVDRDLGELSRESAVAAAYECYVQEAAKQNAEIEIPTKGFSYYALTVPTLSTGQTQSSTNVLQVRLGRLDGDESDENVALDICFEGALATQYRVASDQDSLIFTGSVIQSADTQTYSETLGIDYRIAFRSVSTVPLTGDIAATDLDTGTFDVSWTGSHSEGDGRLECESDRTRLESSLAISDSENTGEWTADLVAMWDTATGAASFTSDGTYAPFSKDELVSLGVPSSLLTGSTYCYDPDVAATSATSASCAPDITSATCYGLVAGTSCLFNESSDLNAFSASSGLVIDSTLTAYSGSVNGASPNPSPVLATFPADAWDCSVKKAVEIDLSSGDFSACENYLSIAFPDALPEAAMKATDREILRSSL